MNTASGDFVFGMTEAYLIEDGEITEPLREANLIGNGPQALRDIDAVGNDFAMGGPGTCGKDGQGVPVGTGQPTLRVAAMTIGGTAAVSEGRDELQALADKVVAQAQAGEQIEAYVSRGGETEIRVYGGEVEHFVSAQSEGIGVRVVRDGRTGFAYAGTLDPGRRRRGPRRGPRQRRVRHGRRAGPASPSPTASPARRSRCGTSRWRRSRPSARSSWPRSSSA